MSSSTDVAASSGAGIQIRPTGGFCSSSSRYLMDAAVSWTSASGLGRFAITESNCSWGSLCVQTRDPICSHQGERRLEAAGITCCPAKGLPLFIYSSIVYLFIPPLPPPLPSPSSRAANTLQGLRAAGLDNLHRLHMAEQRREEERRAGAKQVSHPEARAVKGEPSARQRRVWSGPRLGPDPGNIYMHCEFFSRDRESICCLSERL